MKLTLLFLILTATAVRAGEIIDQFPSHHTVVTVPVVETKFEKSGYGIKQIGIERTRCFGTCPAYTIIINTDGTFRYHGEDYARRRGDWHGTVDSAALDFVLRYISEMNFPALKDEYSNNESDGWGVYTMVVTRKGKKIVFDYTESAPAKLIALEDMIDRLLEGVKWKRH